MEQIELKDFLTRSVREKSHSYAVDDSDNGTRIAHAYFILDPIEIQVDIICETTGADFSGNDPQNWNYGEKEWDYEIRFYFDGDMVTPEDSGIILPDNWVAEIVREARKMLN